MISWWLSLIRVEQRDLVLPNNSKEDVVARYLPMGRVEDELAGPSNLFDSENDQAVVASKRSIYYSYLI